MQQSINDSELKSKRGRLRFRAWHRGTREMDLLLGSFADQYIQQWDVSSLQCFSELLDENDVDLYEWYTKQSDPSDFIIKNPILQLFLKHHYCFSNA